MNDLPDDARHDPSSETETSLADQDWLDLSHAPARSVSDSPAIRALEPSPPSDIVRALLAERRLEMATGFVLDLLQQRISVGDRALDAVRLVLQHYVTIVSQSVPLSHLGCAPLRPDDRLYQCFSEFVDMLHRQDGQIRELQAIIAELV